MDYFAISANSLIPENRREGGYPPQVKPFPFREHRKRKIPLSQIPEKWDRLVGSNDGDYGFSTNVPNTPA